MMRVIALFACAMAAAACSRSVPDSAVFPSISEAVGSAVMRGADGTEYGTLRVERATGGGVRLRGVLQAVPPGPHGIHIHAVGRCDGTDFTSAGGHLNPEGRQHGLRNPAGPHAGDAPNVVASTAGHAPLDLIFPFVTVDGAGGAPLFDADGSSIVLHATADDQTTDPSGNSGGRIACGVISRSR